MVDQSTIAEVAKLLHRAAPGSKVILFGSPARGHAGPDSDLDFLVVEPQVRDRRHEMVRLRDVVRTLRVPVDVLVVSEDAFDEWADTPGTVYYEACHEGRVMHAGT